MRPMFIVFDTAVILASNVEQFSTWICKSAHKIKTETKNTNLLSCHMWITLYIDNILSIGVCLVDRFLNLWLSFWFFFFFHLILCFFSLLFLISYLCLLYLNKSANWMQLSGYYVNWMNIDICCFFICLHILFVVVVYFCSFIVFGFTALKLEQEQKYADNNLIANTIWATLFSFVTIIFWVCPWRIYVYIASIR